MTAPVRIDAEAWGDLRFQTLARILGFADRDHALIKVARLWSWQAEHYTPDAPTYVVDEDTIDSALGEGGAAAMVRSRLAEEVPEGYRIKGTEGRIEWLWKRRQASERGGEATKRKHHHKEGPGGPAVAPSRSRSDRASAHDDRDRHDEKREPDNKQGPDGQPYGRPEARPNGGPNQGPSSLVPDLLSGDQITNTRARAIPPAQGLWQRCQDWWNEMRAAHRRLRDRGIQPNAPDLPPQCAGVNEQNIVACERSLREAGYPPEVVDAKMRHAIAVAEAACARDGVHTYIKPAVLWKPENFNRTVDTTLEETSASTRAGPRSGSPSTPPDDRPRMKRFG